MGAGENAAPATSEYYGPPGTAPATNGYYDSSGGYAPPNAPPGANVPNYNNDVHSVPYDPTQ